jgi:adenosylcobinamide-phosphate synthase
LPAFGKSDDIVRALKLYRTACALQFTLVAAGTGLWLTFGR